jgi:23S rRNA (pseudouridine1915-N3)-methyltransferase
MKVMLFQIGKTDAGWLQSGIAEYEKRLTHYLSFQVQTLPDERKAPTHEVQKQREGERILEHVLPSDYLVLLDERGDSFTSEGLAQWLGKMQVSSPRRLMFVIGGPFGFSDAVYERANKKLALSQLTFSHQMVRLFFTEQLYRACTILRGESYHHA